MSVEIAWKQNFLVTDFHLLNSLLVVFGFGSQAFVRGFSRQNINSVSLHIFGNNISVLAIVKQPLALLRGRFELSMVGSHSN